MIILKCMMCFCYCLVAKLCPTLCNLKNCSSPGFPEFAPGVCSNSCPLSWWCHQTISFYAVPLSSCPQFFPASQIFSNESALCIRWPKYGSFSFSISPSNEYSGKIIVLTTQTFVNKVMSLLFNTLSRFVIALLPRSKYL